MNKLVKTLGVGLLTATTFFHTEAQNTVPEGWHLKDLETDGFYGISLDKAYEFLKSKGLKSTPVIVGVIDSGIDTTHEDLKPVLWINEKEIPGNGIDDDQNGYVDDIFGWNFLGGKDPNHNVTKDSYEGARVYWKYKSKYEGKKAEEISASEKATYEMWLRAEKETLKTKSDPSEAAFMKQIGEAFKAGDSTIKAELKKEVYNCKDLESYTPSTANAGRVKQILLATCKGNDNNELTNAMLMEELQKDLDKIAVAEEAPKPYRAEVVKDNYDDYNDRYYGNGNVYVNNESALHGTHVSGIIGAARNNGVGMDGVADNVRIMSVRAVPDGDEHDKDIALAIRYAVDNGARVINMSFGKGFSPEKHWIDDAVKYAESKNVLLVHAAGNDAANVDTAHNYPTSKYLDGKKISNWITVGASGDGKVGNLIASFSNYGKKEVDVFAPGVRIYATLPGGNKYGNLQGTSMAAPVVSGIAALIMSYYPNLSAVKVKEIIEKSVTVPTQKALLSATGDSVLLSDVSVTGGIVNAYKAVVMADAESKKVGANTNSKPQPKAIRRSR
jgi:Subtilisin-like serine proteases